MRPFKFISRIIAHALMIGSLYALATAQTRLDAVIFAAAGAINLHSIKKIEGYERR